MGAVKSYKIDVNAFKLNAELIKSKMAKKQNKPVKEENLETILFSCRNSLRGRAAMTDKRDLLLTLVFLKFIGERFKQQKEKIRHEIVEVQGINDTDFIELQLSRPNQYMQDGVFFLTARNILGRTDSYFATSMAIAFDTAIKTLDDNEPKLKSPPAANFHENSP